MSTAPEPTTRLAIVCTVAFVGLNIVFYLMSNSYFETQRPPLSHDEMTKIRASFAVFSAVIAAGAFLAGFRARWVGHALPLLLGAVNIVAGIAALIHHLTLALSMTLLISGLLMPVLSWQSFHRSRPAWAFLFTMCLVFAVAEFFGAPKIRGALDVSLWTTMILPGLNAVAAGALILIRHEYVDRTPIPA